MTRLCAFLAITLLTAACGSQPPALFGEQSLIVNTPAYRANEVFYLRPPAANDNRWSEMVRPHEITAGDALYQDAVANSDPVSIVVNRVLLPQSLTDDGPATRDIAVLLDFAGVADSDQETIAVWYQRAVPGDEPLSFRNLLVYSQAMWDNRVPPYFRIRIVDVTAERNVRTRELLDQVSNFSATLAQIVSTPIAGPVVSLAGRAAQLVLANQENTLLVDFTFNLFSTAQIAEAGGMPLGLFKRGGMMVVGLPRNQTRAFWGNHFGYDHAADRLGWRTGDNGDYQTADAPFLIATVLTSETVIPNVVKQRSQVIADTLSNPGVMRENIGAVVRDAEALAASLKLLRSREAFARFPTVQGFGSFVATVSNSGNLNEAEKFWALSVMRNVTGKRFADPKEYLDWIETCKEHATLDADRRRLEVDATDASIPAKCIQ